MKYFMLILLAVVGAAQSFQFPAATGGGSGGSVTFQQSGSTYSTSGTFNIIPDSTLTFLGSSPGGVATLNMGMNTATISTKANLVGSTNPQVFVDSSGSTTAYIATNALTPLPAYASGQILYFTPGTTATTYAPTANFSSLGAKTLVGNTGSALTYYLNGGTAYLVQYDGTNFRVLTGAPSGGGGSSLPAPGTFSSKPSCTTSVFIYEVTDAPIEAICNGASVYSYRIMDSYAAHVPSDYTWTSSLGSPTVSSNALRSFPFTANSTSTNNLVGEDTPIGYSNNFTVIARISGPNANNSGISNYVSQTFIYIRPTLVSSGGFLLGYSNFGNITAETFTSTSSLFAVGMIVGGGSTASYFGTKFLKISVDSSNNVVFSACSTNRIAGGVFPDCTVVANSTLSVMAAGTPVAVGYGANLYNNVAIPGTVSLQSLEIYSGVM